MRTLPVSNETQERAVALQEADNFGSDTLVNLALDAYELMRELHTGEEPAEGTPRTVRRWEERFDACREGAHYVEVVPSTYGELTAVRTPSPRRPAHEPGPLASRKAPPA